MYLHSGPIQMFAIALALIVTVVMPMIALIHWVCALLR